jgi:hypothetical protein
VEIDLLGPAQQISAAEIQQCNAGAARGIVADIFGEQEHLLADLFLDDESCFRGLMVREVGGTEEAREHAADAPAAAELMRPGKLQIGLQAGAGDGRRSRRHACAHHDGETRLLRQRAELPFDGGRNIAEAGGGGA